MSINKFGQWITDEDFSSLKMDSPATEHAQELEDFLMAKLDELCPTKTLKISSQDKPFINFELKVLSRRKQREYQKKGKSDKYKVLAKQFEIKYKAAAKKYINDKLEQLKGTKPGKAYSVLKSMGAQPGDCSTDNHTFTLPGHLEEQLTDQQAADRIAEHFAEISSEFNPLIASLLPDIVQARLNDLSTPPEISEFDVYEKIKQAKKPQSGTPGDLPCTINKEFSVELAAPLHSLLQKIIQSAEWPKQWKKEFVTAIGKIPNPESEDDLRPISLTTFFSKVLEQFIVMWLLDVIGEKLDFRQYGGTKGNSVAHYLIELINFILFNQDSREPRAVLACLVDFSKAFNRQDHSILVTKLSNMGVPGWLLRLVVAFLKERTMVVRYKGKISGVKQLPGGGPQGTLLGLLLFLVLINDLGWGNQSNNIGEIITCRRRLKQVNEIHLKYVDDLALAEAIDMKSQLKAVPVAERPNLMYSGLELAMPSLMKSLLCLPSWRRLKNMQKTTI